MQLESCLESCCVYTYMYIYMYVRIYICMYIYIYVCVGGGGAHTVLCCARDVAVLNSNVSVCGIKRLAMRSCSTTVHCRVSKTVLAVMSCATDATHTHNSLLSFTRRDTGGAVCGAQHTGGAKAQGEDCYWRSDNLSSSRNHLPLFP